ncbi:60s acidic ribosomal protein [Plasmopara halstedii]|uniref:60s acidic ribosomal protein n=1 Tax=Plasmopara halstedii TaxID=4781 RepID=A0A0P1AZQ4_PLAHL|nr:60s acidic ribosomal protein [Plasmopara halstedii]CEG47568.1 60s acidic ribosomal protein [Plasmopara halstedii]|eukprot:XP_024583937.1 60s acidic ribosomal protein [Plasmopara halstedii]
MSFADLSKTQRDEYAASLAILALYDAGVEITADALNQTFKASGNDVAAYVAPLFADLLNRGLDVEKFLAGPSAGAAPAASTSAGDAVPAKKEEKVVEEEEEVDMGGGMDMFGGDEDY